MLCRKDNLRQANGLAMHIFDRHLAFGVRAELGGGASAGLAFAGEVLENFVGIRNRRRHEFGRFPASVAEHDPLVARPLVLVAGGVDALRDVGGLGMEQDFDFGASPMETVLLVADVLDRAARRGLDRILANRTAAYS